ncbi:hypothetical protein K2F40_04270 [Clostridium sp. CM028]|uniref:hypothetical protein n=1 Tax=unclassified Clostridium TaxID=2614128 RepID=UPI001C0E756C|nr:MULTISPECIES: hypothetical protein [unclassified Clostridium]MBU3093671.1 hypothetical protein [Clostridium sp. CF011]MBW9146153.1 hypothetical protein [Clostridium sp. CM027]MBW9148191.1 hypothetical protein [Clostridium sp. CM028]UVE41673.1 hypothetical protein KTC92_04130 [Clostridium sp. CM027]WAG70672.1 hypothetical protein LL036_04330 [Clostridium sp. CF011]
MYISRSLKYGNKYVTGFKIKNDFPKPVTLRNLLTHTAGLDDRLPLYYKSIGDKFYDSVEPLGELLKRDLPPVIRKPGSLFPAYTLLII